MSISIAKTPTSELPVLKLGLRRVLILGADGFIGRHIAFGLHNNGYEVLACARRTTRLHHMGFETLQADLTQPEAADPEFWRPKLQDVTHVVNAAGLLRGTDDALDAVHVTAPDAVYQALPNGARGVLISAVGIEVCQSPFARIRRKGEAVATRHNIGILRPGLVLGETSYGGSSLARALAAFPLVMPVIGNGKQEFNPIHACDLAIAVAQLLDTPSPSGPHEIGGPKTVTQTEMLRSMRSWLGLRPAMRLPIPIWMSSLIGRLGDLMRLGPISATAVMQMRHGVSASPDSTILRLEAQPWGFDDFIRARPADTQDLWHARLYLMRVLLRIVLIMLWLTSGLVGILLPPSEYLPLIAHAGLPDWLTIGLARGSGVANLVIAAAVFRGWRPRLMALIQGGMVLGYTLAFSLLAPMLWLLPLGGLLKNIPILALLGIQAILEDER